MKYRIVSDSTSNLFEIPGSIEYKTVPLRIMVDGKEYTDIPGTDISEMVNAIEHSKKTSTSCPSTGEYLQAFEGADCVFGITITSGLSGSYNSAEIAAKQFQEENPDARIHVIDSLSTGGEMELLIERLVELMEQGLSFEEIKAQIEEYHQVTHLLFSLECVQNLARNGRVPMAVAKLADLLNIRFIGKPTLQGTIKPIQYVRGPRKNISKIVDEMVKMGYRGGKVRISHCLNTEAAENLKAAVLARYPNADITVIPMTALCSYYAERGGMIIGFEGEHK
ncbi:MAG: DegV family protein [Solobacterium sp.]|nr:DegV family protein [Solobacterium sp.]